MKRAALHLLCWLVVAIGVVFDSGRAAADEVVSAADPGSPVSIVIRDAPIAEVVEMLARKEQVNIVIGKGVEGNVSVNLFEVSLDEAVRTIADAAGYLAEPRNGGYVIITRDDAGLDNANGNTIIRSFKIEYSDPAVVASIVEKHLSRYGKVTVLPDRRLLIVEDLEDFLWRVDRLLAEVDHQPHQILIEAKILEITLDESESFGLDWAHLMSPSGNVANVGVRDFVSSGAGFFFDFLSSDIELQLTALNEKGRVRTLSTPTLLALEHEQAEVVIGDRLGFRVTTTINEVTTESIEFLESGVILRFIASVDRDGRIVLDLHPEVSTGTISDGIPSQKTTEVTTKLIADSGQSVFIGGLIKDSETEDRNGVPVLMDIPYLGRAFSMTEIIDVNTETVVILTARRVGDATAAITRGKRERTRFIDDELRINRDRRDQLMIPVDPMTESALDLIERGGELLEPVGELLEPIGELLESEPGPGLLPWLGFFVDEPGPSEESLAEEPEIDPALAGPADAGL